MKAYPDVYLNDVVENQGKLFDLIAQQYPDMDTESFINTYMSSKTRKSIDEAKAFVNTMDARELWHYFLTTEKYTLKPGEALKGFLPDWIGEFYDSAMKLKNKYIKQEDFVNEHSTEH